MESCKNIIIRLPCIAGFLCRAIFRGCAEIEIFRDIFTSGVNHNPDLCSYILYWSAPLKETLVFQLTLAEAFHLTNNSQNRLLDGQTGERGAQAWKSQVSGIVQPLRCEMMHFETITKPENHLDTVSSRPVAASHHCLEVLAKNLEIQKKMSLSYQEPESAQEKEMHILKSN